MIQHFTTKDNNHRLQIANDPKAAMLYLDLARYFAAFKNEFTHIRYTYKESTIQVDYVATPQSAMCLKAKLSVDHKLPDSATVNDKANEMAAEVKFLYRKDYGVKEIAKKLKVSPGFVTAQIKSMPSN